MRIIKNGKAYDGADAIFTALGQIWDEVVEFSYNITREHQLNHTIGAHKPTSWSMGKESYEGSLTLMMNQAVSLEKAVPGGELINIKPFDVNITFADDYNELINDTVVCKFASQGRTVNTEMGLAQQYDMFVLEIKPNN
ncbi:hypothetical protein [Dysgonomonas termitidis]|uniref:Uncharacterized protein n=1 Tax=Dysgonomonas termitidis TaxID=1516126 RepID=A0ABV9KVD1_9BACT